MGLSRLDNFLKNARGNILYVNPNDLDSTDSIENQGNSLTRPFKTIQRALIEAARFSYQRGLDNDRFGKTTILLYPGDHVVDNRPGWIPTGSNTYQLRNGLTSSDFSAWSLTTNFDLTDESNELYKLNSIHGGVILPRGTSLVGLDLRKTKIRPKYIPNPENDAIERSAIFRVTGACYLWQFSMFDGDPNGNVYKDYTNNIFVPNFSHHKLSCFEYADGVNPVNINDGFVNYSSDRTDLDMYYEKVGLVYGSSSGRPIEPDYPSAALDIQPKVDEYRIVGPTGGTIGISSIRSHDGITPAVSTTTITVDIEEPLFGLSVDTGFQVTGVNAEYDGQYVVSDVLASTSEGTTRFQYNVSNAPADVLPSVTSATVNLQVDTVTSASPYIFNISLRSVYGMCGLLADGDKASGFKSMVVAQFTGIGLQKDKNAFLKYDTTTGQYEDSTESGNPNLNTDSRAIFKPSYRNFHIKTINDAYIQNVSVFAIGFAEHFSSDTGGDQSINNSNSNFGSKSLVSSGFKRTAFGRDDVGYITHIIPPKEIDDEEVTIEVNAIDVEKTVGVASTSRLYFYNQTNQAIPPDSVIQGYRIGAKENDELNVQIVQNRVGAEYSARIIMPSTETSATQVSSKKVFSVGRNAGINSVTGGNTFVLTNNHTFLEGESVRIVSENGHLPDGVDSNRLYYAITSGLNANEIKVAQTRNDAISNNPITLNTKGGILKIESRVSDKVSGETGHPIQYDTAESQWYITVGTAATDNNLYSTIVGLGTTALGAATPRAYIKRTPDNRSIIDTVYRARYVIPSGSGISSARPPVDGFIIQESSSVIGATDTEVAKQFNPSTVSLSNSNELRNFKVIANTRWSSNTAYYLTELPHNLNIGSEVEILNVVSSNNSAGIAKSGYNGVFTVAGITSSREFYVTNSTDPGTFSNNISNRTTSLPTFSQKKYRGTYQVYRSQEIQKYIPGGQDGIYHLLLVNNSNTPSVPPFSSERYSQPIQYLYPQLNRDNPVSDPRAAKSFAVPSQIGIVDIDDPQHSITRENLEKSLNDFNVGVGITFIESNATGTAHTIHTLVEHGLNRITRVSIANSGAGYGSGSIESFYNVTLTGSNSGREATARVDVDATGGITAVSLMHGGTSYQVGDTLSISGIATFAPFTAAQLTVSSVYNNVGDVISINGIIPDSNSEFNSLYRITGISTAKQIQVASASTIGAATTLGVGATDTANAFAVLTGPSLSVSALSYNNTTGIGIVTTSQAHGLNVDNKIAIAGADSSLYNDSFVIREVVNSTTFSVNIGVSTVSPSTGGTKYVYRPGYTSAGGNITVSDENLGGRQIVEYAGITTTLSSEILNASTDQVSITGIANLDIQIGDYLTIGDEIVRVKTTVTGTNPVYVFRGVLGTRATFHAIGSVVRRVNCRPIEFRRNSIIRASGHTFEYLGFGPGNYSTAFPDRQDRILTPQEELLAQSTKKDGGINVYTGMNDKGDFYVGNKKVSSATGQEEVFDTPIPSVTGEDIKSGGINIGFDVLTPLEASISRSLRVEGGPDGNIISEFDGPVVFNNKVVVNSEKGLEADSLFLQGDATVSRKYTVGISTPTLAGNLGDVIFNSTPFGGGNVGWVYTDENQWNEFGPISLTPNSRIGIFDRVGVATTSPGDCTLRVGSGTSLFCVDGNGVGIGTTANAYDLNVNGDTNINGTLSVGGTVSFASTVTATAFVGDGSALTNLPNDSLWAPVPLGIGTGLYPIGNIRVGIGTTIPNYILEVGTPGTGGTDIYVNNDAVIAGFTTVNNIVVGGALTSTTFRLDGASSNIRAGIVTATTLVVGTALSTSGSQVGLGTAAPRAKLDVEGSAKFKTYSENVEALTISSGVVNIDLSKAQTFTLTVSETITEFRVLNPPTGATSFTLKITQNATGGFAVDIDDIKTSGGVAIPVYWPGGGVLPIVTTTANATDLYSFMTFDGCASLFGVVGGQNFS